MNDGFNGIAAWNRFAKSGKINDYLIYRQISEQENKDEAEHGRIDNKGTADGRG